MDAAAVAVRLYQAAWFYAALHIWYRSGQPSIFFALHLAAAVGYHNVVLEGSATVAGIGQMRGRTALM